MPKKLSTPNSLLIPAQQILILWGRAIHGQRLRSRVTAKDLAHRAGVSVPTIARIERGDPAVAAGSYLACLFSLGIDQQLLNQLPTEQVFVAGQRVRYTVEEKGGDLGYF